MTPNWIKVRRLPLSVAAVAAVVTACPPTAGAVVSTARSVGTVDCNVFASYPNVLVSSARNMSCSAGARDMRGYKKPIERSFITPGGFRCIRVSGSSYGGQWRCVNGARAYRFEFGD